MDRAAGCLSRGGLGETSLLAVLGLWCGETSSDRPASMCLVAIKGGGLLPPVELAISSHLRCSSGGADAAQRPAADLGRRKRQRRGCSGRVGRPRARVGRD